MDYEVEVAIVISKKGKNISEDKAQDHRGARRALVLLFDRLRMRRVRTVEVAVDNL